MKTQKNYSLPLRKEYIRRTVSDVMAHRPKSRLQYAVDFEVKVGTPVIAAADGVVRVVYMESSEGGKDEKFKNNINKYTNRIRIDHAENEYSEYGHLDFNSSKVKVGDIVKTGDVIGLSGNTGYSSHPHLHFHVMRIIEVEGKRDWETLEIKWGEEFEILRN